MSFPGAIRTIGAMLLAASCVLVACVYVPPLGEQFTEKEQASIIVGTTTRAEIDAVLGKPDTLLGPRTAIYTLGRSSGTLVGVIGGGYNAAVFAIPLNHKRFRVLVHFDEHDRVDRYEIEAMGLHIFDSSRAGERLFPASAVGSRLLFSGKGRDALGFPTGVAFDCVAYDRAGGVLGAGGYKLVGGSYSSKRVWFHEIAGGSTRTLDVPSYASVHFSRDFHTVAALDRRVFVLDPVSGRIVTEFDGHGDASFWSMRGASTLAISRDGKEIATGGMQGHVRIWGTESGRERLAFRAHDGWILALAWSADGRWIATSGMDRRVRVWDAHTGRPVAELGGAARSKAPALAFSPAGDLLATCQETHIEIWRLESTRNAPAASMTATLDDVVLLPYLEYAFNVPSRIAFSPRGDLLAASRGFLLLYDVRARDVLVGVAPDRSGRISSDVNDVVLALAFSPDGETLATGSTTGVHAWSVARLRSMGR